VPALSEYLSYPAVLRLNTNQNPKNFFLVASILNVIINIGGIFQFIKNPPYRVRWL